MGKTILITGVSSGLGHGLATVYLQQGATVYACSRRVPHDLIAQGLIFECIDLADAEHSEAVFSNWLQSVPHFDLVILNAGKLGEIRDMQVTPLSDLRATMELNVWANKWILDEVLAGARAVRQVVAISSGASQSGSRGWNGYSMSKVALNMLIRLYAAECPETHLIALAPGLVDTAMQDYLTALPEDHRYPALSVLKAAKGTAQMPDGESCARRLIDLFPQLLQLDSGSYADIREL